MFLSLSFFRKYNITFRLITTCTLFLSMMLSIFGCSPLSSGNRVAAPSQLPHTTWQMNAPGFWISRHPQPDQTILTPQQIEEFNRNIFNELKLTTDLAQWPTNYAGETLKTELNRILDHLNQEQLVFIDGKPINKEYWSSMREASNFDQIAKIIPRQYGLIVSYADQRFLPISEGLYAKANDVDFDELQNSALDPGTPVVILHKSADAQWLYVVCPISSGWVKAEHVAYASDNEFNRFLSASFVVITVDKADVYLDRGLINFYGALRMGVRLPLLEQRGEVTEVLVPIQRPNGDAELVSGFIETNQVNNGYLAYTPRQIIEQAFKLLNEPYGWGDMYGAQDCSRFLQEIFATVGITLPRDSKNQIQVGKLLTDWNDVTTDADKLQLLQEKAMGGISLLGMHGHIMLYLGSIDERAYAIHAVWAYRRPQDHQDEVVVLNRVTLSDLSLGAGSRRGSWLKRINAVRLLGL